ncbi:phosphatidylinositol phosphate synthase [Schaalia sp. lx-260]|uniref:phosphatidylinositol phosphate synthase n=1 Tax=Schaalia sp. lx-260 TaxID=2899082 RepID=UPI001E4BAA20|nr:CDP-alcohol phosphatidyltransferase family protein [Schaalia sp. lx-260]MCD4549284.1 CDP-alcohol phosphatidyltransferase family protein [Schaalia sp. lx-260]
MLGNHGRSVARTIFTPPARLLASLGVSPNMVTFTGTVMTCVLSVILLAQGYLWQGGIALGIILFCDSIDGILARLTGKTSAFGAFFDSTMDRLGDGAVFGSLLAWVVFHMPDSYARTCAIIAGIASLIAVGTVPYARARAEVLGVVAKVGIAERTDRLIVALVCAAFTDWGWGQWWISIGLMWVAVASLVTVGQRVVFTASMLKKSEVSQVKI